MRIDEHIWTHSRLSKGHVLLQMRYGTVGCEIGRGEREKQRERNRERIKEILRFEGATMSEGRGARVVEHESASEMVGTRKKGGETATFDDRRELVFYHSLLQSQGIKLSTA